ncbi:class I SAM-dependent methyltransferase [Mycolicibacterium grossiae]|uniref:Methyltransferase n=1 Tax=Mycolicibacterium grossiae TaxID=1552759 RepID=A0A1E8Q0V7_9MYCO|nr:class I SAM-dependent methyltransferase [Mycolicibacterium grossiae]OFJ51514.1 methyltransferase [Mycolicibacterium grossiae]QEM44713.1 class I SAM-dependent methyltransferase [Mycolicibacterium grossiae]
MSEQTGAPATPRFADEVTHWSDIPGWFGWRDGQLEAVRTFDEGSTFVEVGLYLGRSILSLAECVAESGKSFHVIGIDTCRGSGPEGMRNVDAHGPAAAHGGGTFAGLLHRNVLSCGAADDVHLLIGASPGVSAVFADASLDWVHVDARHDYDSVAADIAAWAPKVKPGGWLSGDDYHPEWWPGVVAAVSDQLPDAQPWLQGQWRWLKPQS